MTFRIVVLSATFVVGGNAVTAVADEIPFAAAEAYYSLHLENEPEGVYEWPEQDLIFVQVRIPYGRNTSPDKVEAAELSATRRVLHGWLAQKAAKRRVDPILPFGMNFARSVCRQCFPLMEYTSNWSFSGDSKCFSREKGREHISATVLRCSDVLASMPEAYIEPVENEIWIEGLTRAVKKFYSAQGDLAFVWRIGALDCLDVSRTVKAKFPDIKDKGFAVSLVAYLDEANDTWRDVDSVAKSEYEQVRGEMVEYLVSSPVAVGFRDVAIRLTTPAVRESYVAGVPVSTFVTNVVVDVVTNKVDDANLVSNSFVVASSETDGAVVTIPEGDRVSVLSVRTDENVVSEVVTRTIVCTTRTVLRKTEYSYSGNPRFEQLFLSGGCIDNKVVASTVQGLSAQKIFFGTATMEERERVVLNALRENPGDKVLWNLYGRIFQSRKDWFGALVCFRNALRLDREYEFALVNLADTYWAMGRKNLAVGTAILARGVTVDSWCVKHSEAILYAKW